MKSKYVTDSLGRLSFSRLHHADLSVSVKREKNTIILYSFEKQKKTCFSNIAIQELCVYNQRKQFIRMDMLVRLMEPA